MDKANESTMASSRRKAMNTLDEKLVREILLEIHTHLGRGVLPVHNGHLQRPSEDEDMLEYLILMKREGLISGDVVTKGVASIPYRMTNIRLTYAGIRALGLR
jgi:hypothetical protein